MKLGIPFLKCSWNSYFSNVKQTICSLGAEGGLSVVQDFRTSKRLEQRTVRRKEADGPLLDLATKAYLSDLYFFIHSVSTDILTSMRVTSSTVMLLITIIIIIAPHGGGRILHAGSVHVEPPLIFICFVTRLINLPH